MAISLSVKVTTLHRIQHNKTTHFQTQTQTLLSIYNTLYPLFQFRVHLRFQFQFSPKWTPIHGSLPVSPTPHAATILDPVSTALFSNFHFHYYWDYLFDFPFRCFQICFSVETTMLNPAAMIYERSISALFALKITTSFLFVATLTRNILSKPTLGYVYTTKKIEFLTFSYLVHLMSL